MKAVQAEHESQKKYTGTDKSVSMESYLELLQKTGSNLDNRFWEDTWTMVYNQAMEVTYQE